MIRSPTVLVSLCLALGVSLPACPGGTSSDSDANVQPGTHQIVILTPPGRTIRLEPMAQETLAVRYLDPQGIPVRDAQISFTLEGETGGATLAGFHALTDPSGTAEMGITAGAESIIFTVEVTAANALPVQFEVAVSVTGFVNIEVLSVYDGTRSATSFDQITAGLYYGDLCSDLNPVGQNQPDRARVTPDGFGTILTFENLPADLDYAIALGATDSEGNQLAWGCADVASLQLLPGATVQLGLTASDLAPDATGPFGASTTVELTAPQAETLTETLAPLTSLGTCPFDPVDRLLDCIVDAVSTDGAADCVVEATDEFATHMQTVRGQRDAYHCRTSQSPGSNTSLEAIVWEATDATGLGHYAALAELAAVEPTLMQTLELHSRLTLVAAPEESRYFLWHALDRLALPQFAPDVWIELSQLGGLVLEVSSLEADYTFGSPTLLSVPSHTMTLHPRWAALAAAHAQYLAPAGLPSTGLPPDLESLIETVLQSVHYPDSSAPLSGCEAVDAHLCDAVSGQVPCPQDACMQGVALLADLADAHWSEIPPATQPDVTFTADIPLTDGDGDLTVDRLGSPTQPLSWQMTLHLGDTWTPPQSATFTATRLAPVPQ
jgi:hypothetical protein